MTTIRQGATKLYTYFTGYSNVPRRLFSAPHASFQHDRKRDGMTETAFVWTLLTYASSDVGIINHYMSATKLKCQLYELPWDMLKHRYITKWRCSIAFDELPKCTYTYIQTFSALLAICAGNSPVTGEFPARRPVTRSFDVFFDLRLNKRLSKQPWGWWFETPLRPLWRHCNEDKTSSRPSYLYYGNLDP